MMGCYLFPAVSHRRTHCRIRFLPAFRAAFRPVILGVERIAIARAASLPDSRAASLVDYPSSRLSAVRTNFIPLVPPSRNVYLAASATSSPFAPVTVC